MTAGPPALALAAALLAAACGPAGEEAGPSDAGAERPGAEWREARATSADGHSIAYVAGGTGEPALVFVHCGFCDRGVWAGQLERFAERHRVAALDLAGHGDSAPVRAGASRDDFAADVEAVVEALELERVILVGSSFGGVVALDAAAKMPGRVLGIVAVDTLHDLSAAWDEEAWRAYIDSYESDFDAACAAMFEQLFHPDADPDLRRRLQDRMCGSPPELASSIFGAFHDYDWAAAARAAGVPIRAIQGDVYPTAVEANREIVGDYEAAVLEGIGHFPMLEAPELFDRHLAEAVADLAGRDG